MKPFSVKDISIFSKALLFLGLLIVQSMPLYMNISFPMEFWIKQIFMYVLWISVFYLTYKIIIPTLLFQGKNGFFFIAICILIVSVLYISDTFNSLINLDAILNQHFKISKKDNLQGALISNLSEIIITLLMVGASTVISVAKKLQVETQVRQNLEKEKVTSELSFLKSQINPHFFFNILNSIYALAGTENQPAREAIYTLSHMMRYVLYDTKNNLTTLTKEIGFVTDYLKLMELRITDKVQVIFEKPTSIKDVEVAPMLFLPFIENAYKHGISGIYPSYIYIGIEQSEKFLQIEVRNSIFENQTLSKEESNGIGLINTRRRLDLIYPGKYELSTNEDTLQMEYTVILKLQIS
ncbi:sensor histidine kinase [Flavobacterium yafengii]|uniref:sensor histidine kinase n=1 Tax=Flavobacterium yafengii TaxID=3041253 RepID=UPI0024A8309B|nr:histidine kinase [Flavobacterium yafengii]MDI6045476.1 histidine kinase [Flavobacterium yafengii]